MTGSPTAVEAAAAFEGDPARPDVWLFDRTDAELRRLALDGAVSDEDRLDAERLSNPEWGVDLLARRALTRRILALYLAREPADVRIVRGTGGRPMLLRPPEGHPVGFSTATSAHVFCLAIGARPHLGVDVEWVRPMPKASTIVARCLLEGERDRLRLVAPKRRDEELLRLWTAKKALAKRQGGGIVVPPREGRDRPALDVLWEAATGHLVHFTPEPGFVGSIAAHAAITDVRIIRRPLLDP